jgi:AcrR family transcriptional regulator
MARPRKVSDEQVFAAAQRVMARVGPSELTLGLIGEEAGLTAGALVQRFGSKRNLMVRMAGLLAGGIGELFAGLRAAHRSPLAVIRAYATCMASMAATPDALARNLAYLQVDLTDPDLRAHLLETARETRRELLALVAAAKERGELAASTPAAPLVRNIEALVSGALLTWAFHREGDAASWLKAHVDALLAPHRAVGKRVSRTGRSR